MRCTRCVLGEHTPKIVFDGDGVCNYCHTYQPFIYKGEAEAVKALDAVRGGNGRYDCIVGLSGGRDSTYVLLKLVKDYGMKVLAVNYENPFTVLQARTNIENATRALGVDVVAIQDRRDNHVRAFRSAVSAWFHSPSAALIPIVCIGCKPVWLDIYRIAKKNNIRCVVTGGNPYEIISFKRELVKISRDEDPRKAFFKYIYSAREVLKNQAYFRPHFLWTVIKAYLFGAPFSLGLRLYGPGIRWIQLFDYLPWDERVILSRIRSELDWDHPANLKSTWRFDCRVKHLVDFMYLKTLNMTDKDDFYAKMVRESKMTRQEALERLEAETELHMEEIEILLDQAGMKETSFLGRL